MSRKIPYAGYVCSHLFAVARKYRKLLGKYLREQRGELSLNQFAKKLGISDSTLQRLEIGEQNITIDTLEQIAQKTGADIGKIFGDHG